MAERDSIKAVREDMAKQIEELTGQVAELAKTVEGTQVQLREHNKKLGTASRTPGGLGTVQSTARVTAVGGRLMAVTSEGRIYRLIGNATRTWKYDPVRFPDIPLTEDDTQEE